MIALNPYTLDDVIYPVIPRRHRWIFNKLELALRLGVLAGPCGTVAPAGELCVRPIMNVKGNGGGGFFRVAHEGGEVTNRPGYFWTSWLDGEHHYIYYVKDKAWYDTCGVIDSGGRMTVEESNPKFATLLPRQLKRISRYMMLQTIGGVITEVSPRHTMINARPKVIADYQKVNPVYGKQASAHLSKNFVTSGMVLERVERDPYGLTGWTWKDDPTTAVPFVDKFG